MQKLMMSFLVFALVSSGNVFAHHGDFDTSKECLEKMKVERKESAKLAAVSFPLVFFSDPTVLIEGSKAANYKRMLWLIKEAQMGKVGRYTRMALKKVNWQVSAPELHRWTTEKLNMGLFCSEKMPWNFLNWKNFMREELDVERVAQGLEPLWKK